MINWTVVAIALLSQVLHATGTGSGRINQRFLSIYLLAKLKLINDPQHNQFEISKVRTHAFSQTY